MDMDFNHILSLSRVIDNHRQLVAPLAAVESRKRISERLKVDSHFFLYSYWMLIAGHRFKPPEGTSSSWNWPLMDMEFDHQGRFEEIPINQIHYSGGEPKFSFSCTFALLNTAAKYLVFPGAQKQLESGFKCIDEILLNLGFFKSALYTGKVYVPYIPIRDTTARFAEQLKVMRYRNLVDALAERDLTLQLQEI